MKVLIIGGVATGPKVAARLRRLRPEAEITIVEQGTSVSYGACGLPLYLANLVPQIDELTMTSYGLVRDEEFFANHKGINVLTGTRAIQIDRQNKVVRTKNLSTGAEEDLNYDYLVLATGAKPVVPKIPGVELKNVFTLNNPGDAQSIKKYIQENKIKHLTIVGAGLIGIETADALAGPRLKVSICESASHVLPKMFDPDIAKLFERKLRSRGVDVRLGCKVVSLEGCEQVKKVILEQGQIETEMVIFTTGVRPEVGLAQAAGLEIGNTGAIKVDSQMMTNDPFIYAGGDCAEQTHLLTGKQVYIPLASTANKQGRVIADNIAGLSSAFPGVSGTSVLQAFEFNMGRTGLGEEEAKALGYDVICSISSGLDSTHFYPMHSSITVKLLAERATGKVLGVQICGLGEAIKRVDVVAAVLKFGGTLEDLSNIDLGYAPPFSTAIDVLIHAANTLDNKRKGIIKGITAQELYKELCNGAEICILDVREEEEFEANPVKGEAVIKVPIGELRARVAKLSKECKFDKFVTVCELGIRGYEAACLLKSAGYDVRYLEGGMSVWSAYQSEA